MARRRKRVLGRLLGRLAVAVGLAAVVSNLEKEAKEEGKDSFLNKVKHGKNQTLWGPYSLNSVRALARRIAPAKCARYCWIRKIMVRQAGSYVIWDESKLNSPS